MLIRGPAFERLLPPFLGLLGAHCGSPAWALGSAGDFGAHGCGQGHKQSDLGAVSSTVFPSPEHDVNTLSQQSSAKHAWPFST